uniref:Uncharacterized protein n=1 Tax=uncultured marine group II/III euryarchaeote KM3_85_D06 TaxID=1456528 RepID=A0A075HRV0_9EURY|nr:hypothetical protein [uncultured marine group II/III euryarchaeote KM3_85_D06]
MDDEVDCPDVYSQFQRGGGYDAPQLTVFQPLFDLLTNLLVHRTVVRLDCITIPRYGTAQLLDDLLSHPSCIDEYYGRRMRFDEVENALDVCSEDLLVVEGGVTEPWMR